VTWRGWTCRPALVALALVVATPTAGQVVFRSSVASVTVDVSVRHEGRTVADLGVTDFELRDSDLVQQITEVTRETLPIDVTFIIDLSGSVQGPLLAALTRSITTVGQQLRDTDRASVVTFNHQVRQVRPLTPGGWPAGLELGTPTGLTSLFDALTVALIAPPEIGRRRMAIVFTDGIDTTSFLDGTGVIEIARRATTSVFIVALSEGTVRRTQRPAHETLFRRLAETTGGALEVLQRDEDVSRSFAQAFEDFRTSYVLHYTYDGPAREGWHPLVVRVTRPGVFDVRARQGYFSAGQAP
jgi:Ca-activated chloride channel family protein